MATIVKCNYFQSEARINQGLLYEDQKRKMILTYKVKHNRDFSVELQKAKKIAKFAVKNRDKLSTKHVAHLGLKSVIANQILREYERNKKCKMVLEVSSTSEPQ